MLCFWLHLFCQASEEQRSSKDGKGNTQYQQSKGAAKRAAKKKDKKGKGKVNKNDKKREGDRQYVCPYVNSCVTCDLLFALSFFE